MSDLPLIALLLLAAIAAFAVLARRQKSAPSPSRLPTPPSAPSPLPAPLPARPELPAAPAPLSRPALAGAAPAPRIGAAGNAALTSDSAGSTDFRAECLKLAFGIARSEEAITGRHARVLANVAAALERSLSERDFFPRRPLHLPKLLKTLNDGEATRQVLAQLVLEDPALASAVLQRANSPAYRNTPAPVESIDSALLLLGTEGLRALLALVILQPVFRVPRGYFDNFASITWEQAERTSAAAEVCSRQVGADAFVAQLLGLLGMLAHIVVFRLTMEKYREQPDLLPNAAVFMAAIQTHRARVAALIASSWELSPASLAALAEQSSPQPGAQISALGRTTRLCALCGALATLAAHGEPGKIGEAEALAVLAAQGLQREAALPLWRAARR